MATFLDKNKKKSALAALLLFIRTRKTLTALLLLVALASFLFVSPSNMLLSFPGGARVAAGVAWIAGKIGVDTSKWGLAGGKRDYGDLLAAFRAAKDGGGKAGWAAFMQGGAAGDASRIGGGSGSLDFVKGNAKDLETRGGDGANLPKAGSVAGVLNPDDAKNRGEGEGVALSESDVSGERAGLVKSAFAGGFANGGFGNAGGPEGLLSGGAFANAGFFGNGKGAASGKLGDVVRGGLDGIQGQTAKGVQIQGAAKGQLSASKASVIDARSAKGLVGTHTISGQRAFVQLAAGRGRASISVSPNCTPGSGCPGEFASVNTGAVYDGNSISGDRTDILTAPQIDGITTPNVPDTGMADDYVKQAEKMQKDADACKAADAQYGPLEQANDQKQQGLSDQFNSMGCGQGGCSKSKAHTCQAIGDQMKDLCRATMKTRCDHIAACPLTAGNTCDANECDGSARNKTSIGSGGNVVDGKVEGNNGATDKNITIRTTDQGNDVGSETPQCTEAKRGVVEYRQATQNAIDQYRGQGCEALYPSPLLADKIKYLNKCSGPDGQVIKMCTKYANSLCSRQTACTDENQCTGDSSACKINDLNSIEEFIQKEAKQN
jgi:hypothetical protein